MKRLNYVIPRALPVPNFQLFNEIFVEDLLFIMHCVSYNISTSYDHYFQEPDNLLGEKRHLGDSLAFTDTASV